jgi:exosortase H (IPTLxxWG-CTERM-specific)
MSSEQHEAVTGLVPRLRAFWANPVHRFGVLFITYIAAASFLYPSFRMRFPTVMGVLESGTATLTYHLMRPFTSDLSLQGDMLALGGFHVKIIEECTGLYEAMIFTVAILAFPTRRRSKLLGLALGIPFIYVFNLFRIVTLLVVGRDHRAFFEFFHIYAWQGTWMLMVASLWLAWLFWFVDREEDPGPDS